jgi:RCC1 and BTB domain-containing protein
LSKILKQFQNIINRGYGSYGQLGHGNTESQLTPKKVEALANEVIVDVACGEYHTCAVTSTGKILTWGHGIETGHDEDSIFMLPRLLQDLSSKGVVSVSANRSHTACVTKDGEWFTWGDGRYGQLGHGDETSEQCTPKRVEALVGVNVTMVSCGWYHTAVCTEDGRMHTFGKGEQGQLGHGDRESKYSPTPVLTFEGKHITQVQCGSGYTMALTSTSHVFTWGDGEYGVLGHGDVNLNYFSFPCLVEGLREHNVVQISSGYYHCAVLVDSTNPSDGRQSQQASFNNKEHSDVVFKVDNQSLYSNIKVLTQKNVVFEAMFRHNMRESIDRVVQVPNFSKAAFLHVLEYIHLDDFTVSMDDVVELWGAADYYQMEGLKYSCMGALERGLSKDIASQILRKVGVDLSCFDELRTICHKYLEQDDEDY